MKNSLKLAGTINTIIAIFLFLVLDNYTYPIIHTALALSSFVLSEKSISYLYNKKTLITLLGISSFLINIITGIIIIIGKNKLQEEYKGIEEKEEIQKLTKDEKKISLLLNLGIALVSISGIILISTNWQTITDTIKLIILLAIAIMFLILSNVCENKLKIKMLSKTYWLLSMLFIVLALIGNGYFQTISVWFSFNGDGNHLYMAFTTIVISLLSLITHNKTNDEIYKKISYTGILSSIGLILLQFKVKTEIVLSIISIVLIVINEIKNEKLTNIKELSKYLTIILSFINIMLMFDSTNIFLLIILALSTILSIITITTKELSSGIISAIVINLSVLIPLCSITSLTEINEDTAKLIAISTYSLLYLFNLLKIENKTFKNIMNVTINLAMLILLMISIENKQILTLTALLITLTSILNYTNKEPKIEKILLPVKIVILILSTLALLQEIIQLEISYILILVYLLAFVIYKLFKNKNLKALSLIIYYIIFVVALRVNENSELIPSIINLVSAGTIFLLFQEEKNTTKTRISYIALLIAIASIFEYTNILKTTTLINGIMFLLVYMILTILTHENKEINKISYLSIILPLSIIADDFQITSEIRTIAETSVLLYIIGLITIFLIKKEKTKDTFASIAVAIILLNIIFIESWIIGIFIGIISLSLITIGFIKKDYKKLFIVGIIATIINLLVQLQYILKELPLWIYTLLAGFTLIGLVTYKIVKDNEK